MTSLKCLLLCTLLIGIQQTAYGQSTTNTPGGTVPDVYEVKSGDTLWSLSEKFYGDSQRWKELWKKNAFISDPDNINPGLHIIVDLTIYTGVKDENPIPALNLSPQMSLSEAAPPLPLSIMPVKTDDMQSISMLKERTAATVRILFTNNSNGKLEDCGCRNDPYGGLAERVDLIRKYRATYDNIVLLDSGGYFGLSQVDKKGPVVLTMMEEMGYDAWGIGDQELYFGLSKFLGQFDGFRDNIINASLSTESGDEVFRSYRIITVAGFRVGVIGLSGPSTFRFFPENRKDFAVEETNKTLGKFLPKLKESCDYIVVLSQMGNDEDKQIAKEWPDIDLIIGGHSQTLISEAINVSGCRIVQAGKNGGRVGEIILDFDAEGSATDFSYRLIEVNKDYRIPDDMMALLVDNSLKLK